MISSVYTLTSDSLSTISIVQTFGLMGFVTMYMFYVCWDVMFHQLIL